MITADSFLAEQIFPGFSDSACFSCVWLGIYRHPDAAR
jgi:hypothetical protein